MCRPNCVGLVLSHGLVSFPSALTSRGGSSRAETGQALSLTHFFTLSHYGLALSSLSKTNTKPCLSGLVEGGDMASLALSLPFDKHLVGYLFMFSVPIFISPLSTGFTTLLAPINSPSSSLCSLLVEFVFLGYYPLARGKRSQSWTTLVPGSAGSPAP